MNLINAFGLLNMIREDLDDYQEEYRNYILEHKKNVEKFADWLKKNLPEIFFDYNVDPNAFDEVIREHDESKFSEEEFEPYANFWYNDSDHYDYDPEYEAAWEHHWMNNEHHPEHWLGSDMPYIYILEMLCDWGSFSIAKNNFKELSSYYYNEARDDEEKNLSENTKIIIEEILTKIDGILNNSLTEEYENRNSEIFGTDFLYHATYRPYWEEIQKDGFIVGGKHCNWQDLSKPNLIYLARDPEVAISYCETNDEVPEELLDEIVVLRVDINKLNIDSLNIDENVAYSYDSSTDPDYPETWQEFQYKEKIPVSILTKIDSITDKEE